MTYFIEENIHLPLSFIWCYQLCSAETDNIQQCFGNVFNSVKVLQSQQTTVSNLFKSSFELNFFIHSVILIVGKQIDGQSFIFSAFAFFCCFRKFKEPNITFFIFHWFLPKSCLDKYFALVIFLLFYCCIAEKSSAL